MYEYNLASHSEGTTQKREFENKPLSGIFGSKADEVKSCALHLILLMMN
jgi:hypothetical protein